MSGNSFWGSLTSRFSNFADGVGDLFNVGSTVSASSNIKPDDVLKTKTALNAVGSYNVPDFGITDIPDTGMINGLKNFQANNGLKVDGVMKPGGPTENALGQTLANQGISNTDMLEKMKSSSNPAMPDMPKPVSPPQTSWSASTSLGKTPKPKNPKLPKIDPMTGLQAPLTSALKGKMPTKKQWKEVAKMQQQKAEAAIIPQGDTVDQRIRSMMSDKRYGDKHDNRLRDHVQKQFKNAYPGNLKYDETGKMVQPTAAIRPQDVEPFDPDGELKSIEIFDDQNEKIMAQGHGLQSTNGQDTTVQTTDVKPIIMERETSETRPVTAARVVEMDEEEKTAQASSYNSNDEPQNIREREKGRIDKLKKGETIEIDVRRNPNANSDKKIHEVPKIGYDAVRKHEAIIQEMAEKHGADPDLIRAVMWAENARGHKFGLNALGDVTGYSDSKMPMNINPHLWKAILGRDNADLNNPKNNIAAAAILLKRLEKSVKGEKDAAKIGTLWNSAGQSETTDFGEYIGRLYQDKPWLKPDPLEGDQNEPEGP